MVVAKTDTTAYQRVLDALSVACNVIEKNDGKAMAQCPAHDDGHASLSVGVRSDGKGALLYCQAGCDTMAVLDALGMKMCDLFDDAEMRSAYSDRNTYTYRDGRKVHRSRDKRFRQSGNTKGSSLFHAERITDDVEVVYVPEGEKDVLAIEAAGGMAVCSAMGAGKADRFDWSPLKGKHVVIVADKDEAGRAHAYNILVFLDGIAASADIVEAAVGKDAADHIAAGLTLDELVPVGAALLDDIATWFGRFIAVTDPDDLRILALWTAHTYLVNELYTTPRLLVDSTVFGSGKTTLLDHLNRLCQHPVEAALLSSAALLPRLLEDGMRTVLLDEVDRSLRPDKPGVEDLIAVLNSGYRYGATRPVLVPATGGGWTSKDMSTYAPVAMAGNSPNLPADTVSRSIRILLMPDLDGTVEDSDWELIEDEANMLRTRIEAWADAVRLQVKGMVVELPNKCIGRSREKWRPLKRIAVAAGGDWTKITDRLINKSIAEDEAEREAGLKVQPPGMVLLMDLHAVWPESETFVSTKVLVDRLIKHNLDYWGADSPYGKQLTETRFGRLLTQAAKVTSSRPGGAGPRGYLRMHLIPAWHRLGITRYQPGEPDEPGEPGGDDNRVRRVNQPNQVDRDTPPGFQPGDCDDPEPSHDEAIATMQTILGGRVIDDNGPPTACPVCGRVPARTDTGMCDFCTVKRNHQNKNGEASA